MALQTYRGNLKAASFPFLSELQGRTVIVRGQDQNFVSNLAAKDSLDSSIGIPQVYYCHNVVPTDNGYKSVGYTERVAAGADVGFRQVLTIRNDAGDSAQIAAADDGNLYLMEAGETTWSIPTGAPAISTRRLSVAYVSGVPYIYVAQLGCYTYDWGTNTISSVTLTGLTASAILGIVGFAGYILAYSVNAISWSSTIDPTDFTPSLETGAGGGNVEGVKGAIVTVEEVYGGLIIFAAANAVAATYSQNPRYPFNFIPITGCGGVTDPDHVAQDSGTGTVYAYTTSGLQTVSLRSASLIHQEVTDFLSGSTLEDFDEGTRTFSTSEVSAELEKRLAIVADRYLIISYGDSSLTHALYYDLAYKQWGRLKRTHVDCFEFISYTAGTTEVPKKSIAFLSSTGAIHILNSDIGAASSSGVLILGKFQYVRSRLLQLQGVEFENVNQGDTFALYDLPSLDGKNFETAIAGYLASSAGKLRTYRFHNTALNHTIVAIGAFNATSILLSFNIHGKE